MPGTELAPGAAFVEAMELFAATAPAQCEFAALQRATADAGGIPEGAFFLDPRRRCVSCLGCAGIVGGGMSMRSGQCGWQDSDPVPRKG